MFPSRFTLVKDVLIYMCPWFPCSILSGYIVWFRVAFLFSRDTFLIFFSHLHLFDGVRYQYSQVFVGFLFLECSIFSWFDSSIRSTMYHFPLFMTHFSMSNSILLSGLYILTAYMRVSFSFLANSLMSSMYIRWLIFSCNLPSLYQPMHFLYYYYYYYYWKF